MAQDNNSNFILDGIRSGRFIPVKCGPLPDVYGNLAFCPRRHTCTALEEQIESAQIDMSGNKIYEIITEATCPNCPHDDLWLFVGVTVDGIIMGCTVEESLGKELREMMDNRRDMRGLSLTREQAIMVEGAFAVVESRAERTNDWRVFHKDFGEKLRKQEDIDDECQRLINKLDAIQGDFNE